MRAVILGVADGIDKRKSPRMARMSRIACYLRMIGRQSENL
ncbi:hypothetical protein BH24PSE2_BH24PSE2_07240 [soil metagenome]